MRNPPALAARYVAKFRNGAWQVFDAVWYGVVGAEQTEKAAWQRADNLNRRKAPAQVRR
jgi:hypothetical protein